MAFTLIESKNIVNSININPTFFIRYLFNKCCIEFFLTKVLLLGGAAPNKNLPDAPRGAEAGGRDGPLRAPS